MRTFQDKEGARWTLELTLRKTRKLAGTLGLDLLNPNHFLQVLSSLTDRLAFVFLLVEDEATRFGLDADGFEERLYGDGVSTAASIAFLEECESFFRKLGQKALATLARKSIESMKAGQERLDQLIESGQFNSILDQASSELGQLLDESLPSDGNGSPNSPPSADAPDSGT